MGAKHRKTILAFCLAVILEVLVAHVPKVFAGLESAVWGESHESPKVLDGDSISSEDYDKLFRSMMGIHGRQTCVKKEIPIGGVYDDAEDCWYATKIGEISKYGYLFKPENSHYAGYVNSVQSRLVPTHNPDMFMELVPAEEGGYEIHFRDIKATEMRQANTAWEYPIFYEWKYQPTKIMTDVYGKPVTLDEDAINNQIWYSKNGRWMALWHKDGYVTRVDLESLKFLTLQAKLPNDGDEWFASLDVSPDGGQIAVNIFGRPLRLVDAEACSEYESRYVHEPEFCGVRFLNTYLAEALDTYMGYGSLPLFKDNKVLEFYMLAAGGEYWSYYIFAPGTYEEGADYIALGDSYASGEGAFSYFKGTDIKNVNKCHLSKVSYPYKIDEWLALDSTHSVACSGAKIKNIIGPEFIDRKLKAEHRTNQYNVDLMTELAAWTPGYELQRKFIMEEKPDIATISIGGNDIGFGTKVARCVRWPDTCYGSYEDREEIVIEVNSEYSRLVDTYKQIKREGKLGAKIYVVGYPQVAKEGGKCAFNVRLNSKEVRFSNQLIHYLNSVIKRAAQKAGVTYVDIEDALHGYRLCEHKKPAVHGVTAGDDKYSILGNESYHPTESGNSLIGEAILRETDEFTKKNPRPDISLRSPEIFDATTFLDGEEKTHRRTLATKYNHDITQDFYMRGLAVEGSIHGATYDLRPHSPYEFVFTSDPVSVGTFMTDQDGNLQYKITIPSDMQPGFHMLHIYGQDNAGRQIDIYKDVFIAASEEDWDGDGILNKDSPCKIALPNPETGVMELNWCMAQGTATGYPEESYGARQGPAVSQKPKTGVRAGRSEKLWHNNFRQSTGKSNDISPVTNVSQKNAPGQGKHPKHINEDSGYAKIIVLVLLVGLLCIGMLSYRQRKRRHA